MEHPFIERPPKREWHGTHHRWSFRPHAFRWDGATIAGINFVPVAGAMRAWLNQKGHLFYMKETNKSGPGRYFNPYTFSGSTLAMTLARAVNAAHDFETSEECELDNLDAEIDRLRLQNEVVLLAARFTETAIKQLLYCTQIPEKHYQRMSLGALLESPCPTCKKSNGDKSHLVSLVGTLAHPFHLCIEFDHCALDHMFLVNKLRNSEAAHSDVQTLDVRTAAESKARLQRDLAEIIGGFVHMLTHLEKLEKSMLDDLALKGVEINRLKAEGLPPDDCNFNLVPGKRLKINPTG